MSLIEALRRVNDIDRVRGRKYFRDATEKSPSWSAIASLNTDVACDHARALANRLSAGASYSNRTRSGRTATSAGAASRTSG